MRSLPQCSLASLTLLLATFASAQDPTPPTGSSTQPAGSSTQPAGVALPQGLGNLLPGSSWTVLRGPDIERAERPSDPSDEPARGIFLSMCKTLVERARAGDHVLLHQPANRPNLMRVINAYSAPRAIRGEDLCARDYVAATRAEFERELSHDANTLEFVDERVLDLYPTTKSLALTFRITAQGNSWFLSYYLVPAGQHMQYFEAVHFPGDPDGRDAIEDVLRTFDGAQDPQDASSLLRSATIGGITGGIAGVLAALVRRRRRERRKLAEQAAAEGR